MLGSFKKIFSPQFACIYLCEVICAHNKGHPMKREHSFHPCLQVPWFLSLEAGTVISCCGLWSIYVYHLLFFTWGLSHTVSFLMLKLHWWRQWRHSVWFRPMCLNLGTNGILWVGSRDAESLALCAHSVIRKLVSVSSVFGRLFHIEYLHFGKRLY